MGGLNGRDAGYSASLPAAGWTDVSDAYKVQSPWGDFKVWKRSVSGSIALPRTTRDGIVAIFVKGVTLDSVTILGIASDKGAADNGAAFHINREYAFKGTLPESLQGEVLIKTPHDFPTDTVVTIQTSAEASYHGYQVRPLVADEGRHLGGVSPLASLDLCAAWCTSVSGCHSFAVCQSGPSGCWMKDKFVNGSSATTSSSYALDTRKCATYYKAAPRRLEEVGAAGSSVSDRMFV